MPRPLPSPSRGWLTLRQRAPSVVLSVRPALVRLEVAEDAPDRPVGLVSAERHGDPSRWLTDAGELAEHLLSEGVTRTATTFALVGVGGVYGHEPPCTVGLDPQPLRQRLLVDLNLTGLDLPRRHRPSGSPVDTAEREQQVRLVEDHARAAVLAFTPIFPAMVDQQDRCAGAAVRGA